MNEEAHERRCPTCDQRLPRARRTNAPEGFAYCGKCKALLPVEQFHADSTKKSGHSSACASCTKVDNATQRNRAKPNRRRYKTKPSRYPVPTYEGPFVYPQLNAVDNHRAEVLAEYHRSRAAELAAQQDN